MTATIDPTRAQRAREIYAAMLQSPAICKQDDSAEWEQLEVERDGEYYGVRNCRPKFKDKPHPESYGADYPMRGCTTGDTGERRTIHEPYNPAAIRRTRRAVLALWKDA